MKIKNDVWHDTVAYLGSYIGSSLVLTDTFRLNKSGKGVVSRIFPVGEYALVFPDRSQHPFLINESGFTLKWREKHMQASGSKENKLYLPFLQIEDKIELLRKKLRAEKVPNRSEMEHDLEMAEVRRTLFLEYYSKEIANTLAGKIINAICVPNDLEYYNDFVSSAKYQKEHFFDNLSLEEPFWYHTRIFHDKIRFYLLHVCEDDYQSLIPEITAILEKSKPAPENFRFLLEYWTAYYLRVQKPDNERVFAYLMENYINAKQAEWMDEGQKLRFSTQYDILKNQLLDDIPPHLELWDENKEALRYEENREKYQMLIFWDPGCVHCQYEVPRYHKVYEKYKDKGFSVVAIYGESNESAWLDFIKENGLEWMNGTDLEGKGNLKDAIFITETPTVLLLDADGKIIDKRFSAEELNDKLKVLLAE